MDEMTAAIALLVELMKNSSPFKHSDEDPDSIPVPFHEKIFLYRMIVREFWESVVSDPARAPIFSKKPKYRTFLDALRQPRFKDLAFHRAVKIGRCPKCCLLQYKCRSAKGPAERQTWQRLAAAHQTLQLAQKQVYSEDRARAAKDFPKSELYLGFDGGSGHEFWLPHLSANDTEGPDKTADNVHTPGFKIMNGLVHGDTRSHII